MAALVSRGETTSEFICCTCHCSSLLLVIITIFKGFFFNITNNYKTQNKVPQIIIF